MLKGFYRSPEGKVINLEGYDFEGYLALRGSYPTFDDMQFYDKGFAETLEDGTIQTYACSHESSYIQVNSADIKLDAHVYNGIVTNYNQYAFSRLGSILRGMKDICIPQREESYNSLTNTSKIFGEKLIFKYNYQGSYTELREGLIFKLEYKPENFEEGEYLYLEEKDVPPNDTIHGGNTRKKVKIKLFLEEFLDITDIPNTGMGLFSSTVSDSDIYSLAEIVEMNPDKSYAWLKDRKYYIINDLKEWKTIAKRIMAHKGVVSFDTETTGLKFNFKRNSDGCDTLVGLVFSIVSGEAFYIPVRHKRVKNIVPLAKLKWFIETFVKPILESKDILAFNGGFDMKVMYEFGVLLNLKHDMQAMLHLTWGNLNFSKNKGIALKRSVKKYLNRDSFELSDFVRGKFGKDSDVTFADFPEESVRYYACPDTDSLLDLYELAMKEKWLEKFGARWVYEKEVEMIAVIAYQEYFGHHMDVAKSEKLKEDLDRDLKTLRNKIFELVGYEFNLNSTPQLRKALFEDLGLPVLGSTDTGSPSTSKDVLKKYDSTQYPIIGYLQKYAESNTLYKNFVRKIDDISTKDGFIFSDVIQFLETGRMATKDPNYQSYSDTVKKYITPRDGYYMMDADYSSVEIRIMMSMARETELIKYLFDPDADYHTYKASQMYGVPYELVTGALRGQAKGANFGIVYGMGDYSLGLRITGDGKTAKSAGARLRKLYFTGMGTTEVFIEENKRNAVVKNYAETFFGRRRYFPPNMSKGSKERQGGNHPIQGTAADLYKTAMVKMYKDIIQRGWWGKVLLPCFIHDEILIESHNSINPAEAMKMVRDNLMLDLEGWCPLYIGFGFGDSWYNAKKTEVPVVLQNELIDKYSETGFPFWDGNIRKLYAWEVRQIYEYEVRRIIEYAKDPENHNKVVKPIISAFLNNTVGYFATVYKFVNEIGTVKENIEKFRYCLAKLKAEPKNPEVLKKFVRNAKLFTGSVDKLASIGVEIGYLYRDFELTSYKLSKEFEFVGTFNVNVQNIIEYSEKLKSLAENLLKEVETFNYIDGLIIGDYSKGSISQNLVTFGKAMGVSEIISNANILEPVKAEVKEDTSENFELDYQVQEEKDLEVEKLLGLSKVGFYRNFDENVLYLNGSGGSKFVNILVKKVLDSGGITVKSENFKEVNELWEEGSQDYVRVVFVLEEGKEHPAKIYLPRQNVSGVSTFTLGIRRVVNG